MFLSQRVSARTGLLALVACAFLLSPSCKSNSGDGEGSSKDNKQGTAAKSEAVEASSNVFNYALADDPQTFDTAKMSGAPEGRVAFNVFEGLLMPAQTTENANKAEDLVRPGVAKEWSISEDGTVYTFQLRKDAKWSNGDPVTAEDFKYAWKRVLTPGFDADYAQLLWVIESAEAYNTGKLDDFGEVGVEAPGKHTLKVTLENPTPYFLELTAFYTFFPQPKKVVEKHGEAWTRAENIVSNGPYTLKSYTPQQDIVLEKSDSYWDADNVAIPKAVLKIIKDRNAVVNAYKAGDLHWTGAGLPIAQISSLIMHEDYFREPMLGSYYYRVNVSEADSPLSDPKVIRALSYAINRKSIVKMTMKGLYKVPKAFVPSNLSNYESTVTTEFDIAKAKKLLQEAGYPNGEGLPTINLLYNTDKNHKLVAENIQNMWSTNLGVNIELVNTEWKTYLERVDNKNYQIARAGWIGDYNDPMTFLGMWVTGNGNNDTGWSNEQYDTYIKEARSESDRAKRKELLQKAEALLLEKGPVIPIYEYSSHMLLSSKVEGFKPHNRNIHLLKDLSLN